MYPEKFCKIHTEPPLSKFLFKKIRGLQLVTLLKRESATGVFL